MYIHGLDGVGESTSDKRCSGCGGVLTLDARHSLLEFSNFLSSSKTKPGAKNFLFAYNVAVWLEYF